MANSTLLAVVKNVSAVLDHLAPTVSVAKLAPQYVELEVSFWINTFQIGDETDSASRIVQEEALWRIGSQVMERCRRAPVEGGFTVSANVATDVVLAAQPDPGPKPT